MEAVTELWIHRRPSRLHWGANRSIPGDASGRYFQSCCSVCDWRYNCVAGGLPAQGKLPCDLGRIERALRESTSPRDWALAAQLYKPPSQALQADADLKKGKLLRRAAEAAPNDRFVQWAWANATAAASGCDAQLPCPNRSAALAIIEPDNGAAWFPVLHEAWSNNDTRGTDAALAHMAAATRFDDLFVESVAADGTTMFARQAGRGFLRSSGTMTQADADAGRALDWLAKRLLIACAP